MIDEAEIYQNLADQLRDSAINLEKAAAASRAAHCCEFVRQEDFVEHFEVTAFDPRPWYAKFVPVTEEGSQWLDKALKLPMKAKRCVESEIERAFPFLRNVQFLVGSSDRNVGNHSPCLVFGNISAAVASAKIRFTNNHEVLQKYVSEVVAKAAELEALEKTLQTFSLGLDAQGATPAEEVDWDSADLPSLIDLSHIVSGSLSLTPEQRAIYFNTWQIEQGNWIYFGIGGEDCPVWSTWDPGKSTALASAFNVAKNTGARAIYCCGANRKAWLVWDAKQEPRSEAFK